MLDVTENGPIIHLNREVIKSQNEWTPLDIKDVQNNAKPYIPYIVH